MKTLLPELAAGVSVMEDGTVRVEAPAVGHWVDPPRPGTWLGPGSALGSWERLNRRWRLVLPDGASGIVQGESLGRRLAKGYGDTLLLLAPLQGGAETAARVAASGCGLPEGARAVEAPTDGVFYRSADPDSPPFVEAGQRIRHGQPVGLIEVMKTFNQVLFEDAAAGEAEVVEVRCGDGQEVKAGAVLLVVR